MKRFILSAVLLCGLPSVFGQRSNWASESELGFMVGGSYYIGDLNQQHFKNTHLAGGILFRYNIHSRLAWRSNFNYGFIEGSDAESKRDIDVNRNLSFQSKLWEFGTGIEFTYLPFRIGEGTYKGTAYLLAELALVKINPTTDYNGDEIELQPLGTEGQGTSLSAKGNYSLTQLAIPLGVGVRFSLGKNASLNFEYGIRLLFTDYLDDVGGYRYADETILLAENGPIAADLSNRALDESRFGRRGNPATRDWYSFFGAGVTFKLGQRSTCWH